MPNDRPRQSRSSNGPRGAGRPSGPAKGPRKPASGGRPAGRSSAPRGGSAGRATGGPRKEYGDRPPRRDSADRPSRGPRKEYGERSSRPPRAEGDRPARGPRKEYGDRPPRGPRKEYGDRPPRRDSADRPSRGPRKEYGDRPARGPRKEYNDGPRKSFTSYGDGPRGRRDDRGDRRSERVEEKPSRPMTAAEQKAREVRARTGGRRTAGHGEPTSAPKREKVQWVDEGAVRGTARRATKRAAGDTDAPNRIAGIPRADRPLPSDVARDVERGVGARQSKSASERLQKAIDAFERERFAEASRLLAALGRQLPRMALVHELAGLSAYRQGKWRTVVNELEATRVLDPSRTTVLPVLADAYRALHRWAKVQDIWNELKGASPHPSTLAEGRIVAAGALADQNKVAEAIELFQSVLGVPKRIQEYHLRQWYVAADLNDRVGNVVDARRLFDRIAKCDPRFADVDERLVQLGDPR
ncbi:MAG: hypothetical protein RJB08_69 [Actinomycetota bacterium]